MSEAIQLTKCCGAHSTYDEFGQLYCKACFNDVEPGEGDGSLYVLSEEIDDTQQ